MKRKLLVLQNILTMSSRILSSEGHKLFISSYNDSQINTFENQIINYLGETCGFSDQKNKNKFID
jgi:hypothetical protein